MTDRRLWESHVNRLQAMRRDIVRIATKAGFAAQPGQTKYRARPTHVDGIRFASQLEADRYKELKLLRESGEVAWFIRQVPFDVAPGVVYRADFLVVWHDPQPYDASPVKVTVEDCKGLMTANSRTKIAVVEQRYGIKITLLRRADIGR